MVKCEPAGPGNYRINGISSLKTDYYITGSYWAVNEDTMCITAKYNENGALLWHKIYEAENFKNAEGYAVCALTEELVDIKHEIFVLAHTKDKKGSNSVVLIKYDSLGNLNWDHVVQKSRNKINSVLFNDYLNNLYIAGWLELSQDSKEIFVVKYRPSGDLIWQSKYRNKELDFDTLCFCLGKNGQFLIAGASEQTNRFFYIKYDSLGQNTGLVEHIASGKNNSIADIQTNDKGNIYLLGTTHNTETGKDYITLIYNEKDSLVFEQVFDGPSHKDDIANTLVIGGPVEESLFVITVGSSVNKAGIEEVLTIKYDLRGDQLWTKTFKGRKHERAIPMLSSPGRIYRLCNTSRTNFYIIGTINNDVLIFKHSTKGFISWFTRYSTPGAVNRPSAFRGFCVAIESKTEKGVDAYLLRFGKAEQLGIIRWD